MPRFSTIAAAETFATQRLGLTTARLGADLPLAQSVIDGLAAAKSRGATLPPVLRICGRGLVDGQIAYTTPYAKTVLQMNPAAPQLLRPAMLKAEGFGYWGRDAVLLHELGHVGHIKRLGIDPYLKMARVRLTPSQRAIASQVSDYATGDRCEFVAETFVGLSVGRTFSAGVLALYMKSGGPVALRS